ncbi:MAG: hypothetical protein NTV49_00320 [Kiritimatiellaeota bacterium]|nr:hypothetical protein [Kiritimatiellota bacterium]
MPPANPLPAGLFPSPRHAFVSGAAGLAAALLVYIAVLWSGIAAPVGEAMRYDSILTPVTLAILFLALSRQPALPLLPALMLLSAALCGAVLSGIWQAGISDHTLLAGLYSHSDSITYLDGSERLLSTGKLTPIASRRPLTSGILALLLFVCQDNLRCTLAVVVFVCAMAMILPVRQLIRTHGWVAGYAMFLSLFLYYRRYIGSTLTEHTGLLFGCVGFALLWRSVHTARRLSAIAGIFVLTLALCARAGAFLILPALAVWMGWTWRGNARFSLRYAALAIAAACAGFALNSAMLHTVGYPRNSQGNFSLILYGLLNGSWEQYLSEHPEVRYLPELERNRVVYAVVRQRLADQPSSLPAGMWRAYRQFLFSADGPYSFIRFALQRSIVETSPDAQLLPSHGLWEKIRGWPWKYLQIAAVYLIMLAMSGLALVAMFILARKREPASALLLLSSLSIVASAPFVPPWDADLMRLYAATMPLMVALPALGLATLAARTLRHAAPAPQVNAVPAGHACEVLAVASVSLLCLAPCLFALRAAPSAPALGAGGEQTQTWMLRILPGSLIHLRPGASSAAHGGRTAAEDAIRGHMGVLASVHSRRAAELSAALSAGDVLALGFEEQACALRYLVLDTSTADLLGRRPVRVRATPVLPGEEIMWWRIYLDVAKSR